MTKKNIYPNQGHNVTDLYCDQVSRVYVDSGNLFIVLGSITGIETHDAIINNEIARLVIPVTKSKDFFNCLNMAFTSLISVNDTNVNPDLKTDEPEKPSERLGTAFSF